MSLNTPPGAAQAPNSAANSFNATNCDPRLIMVDDAMSLTRANYVGWNKSDIESQMFRETGLDKVISQTKEARMAGAQQRFLTDLLLSRHKPMSMNGGANQSIIQPFRLVPRQNQVNPGYWRISAGASLAAWQGQGGNGTTNDTFVGIANGTITLAHATITAPWVLTLNNGSIDPDSSPFARSPNNVLKNPEKYFLPRHSLTIEFVDSSSNKQTAQVRVVDSAPGPDTNQAYVLVVPSKSFQGDAVVPSGTLTPNGTTPAQVTGVFGQLSAATPGWYESATSAAKAPYQPVTGIATIGANAVSDYQQYGNQLPGYNPYGLIEYWRQTERSVHKYNDEYVKALEAVTGSDGLKKFRLLPLAKLRAQQERFREDSKFNTVFFGDAENENQTTSAWQGLPQVFDPAWAESGETGSLTIEYVSRTYGIRTQIAQCGNVLDSGAGPLDLDALFQALYYVKRERQDQATGRVEEIDIMTDNLSTRGLIRMMMIKYYKAKYSIDSVTAWFQPNREVVDFNKAVMFDCDTYALPDFGLKFNIIGDTYFDDRVAQFQTGQKSAGRALWIIDWSDIAINQIMAKSVPRTNNLSDNVYKYVMQQNVQHVMLESSTFEVAVGNTNRHRIIENFSDACPKLTVAGCDLSSNK